MKLNTIPVTTFLTVSLMLGFVNWSHAQSALGASPGTTTADHKGQGYGFYSIGAITCNGDSIATMHVGGGGEVMAYRGIGLGAELGYLTPHRDWAAGMGVLSLDGSYHFSRHSKWVPFVNGGYTLGLRSGHGSAINYGGGVNYWYRPKQGIRVEFRDIVDPHLLKCHGWGMRIGFAFR